MAIKRRISIEVTQEEHTALTLAAAREKTAISQYVKAKALEREAKKLEKPQSRSINSKPKPQTRVRVIKQPGHFPNG